MKLMMQRAAAAGFTLVELMVAITIGLILLAAIGQLFVTSRATHGIEEALARVQENGRFATDFIAKDLRMAGYLGCATGRPNADIRNWVSAPSFFQQFYHSGFLGYRYTGGGTANTTDWNPALPPFFGANEVLPYSDVIIIQRGTDNAVLQAAMAAPLSNVTVSGNVTASFATGDTLVIADCERADIFKATGVSFGGGVTTITHTVAGNTSASFQKAYPATAEVMKLVTQAYYVQNANGLPGLHTRTATNASSIDSAELVSDIETLKVLYGEDRTADNIVDQYFVAENVSSWESVLNVRVGVVARTTQEWGQAPDTNMYQVLGGTTADDLYDPVDDRRSRRVFSTSVRVRNH